MNWLPPKQLCTGCSACFAVCPRNAISMQADAEGFPYPNVNTELCVKCGLCARVCPTRQQACERTPLAVYAAKAKDETLRRQSSSGGLFSLLAKEVLKKDGVVFGAVYDHDDWHVYHRGVDNDEDLAELRGSKYVQSDLGDTFKQVRSLLAAGRSVLFSGTPCQGAGLRLYLSASNVPSDKLLLVDVVCHAVPSPLAWRKYLEKRVSSVFPERQGVSGIDRISSRSKNCGWTRFSVSFGFANDTEYLKIFYDDPFMRGFLAELYNRLACHNCPCKNLKSGSDLTIADYWGVASKFPEMDDDNGTSLVMVNTDKGRVILSAIKDLAVFQASNYEHACKANPAIISSSHPHQNRDKFFASVKFRDFDKLVDAMLRPALKVRIRAKAGMLLRKLGLRK